MKKMFLFAALAALCGTAAFAAEPIDLKGLASNDVKVVWGGGKKEVSSYSNKIVPAVIEQLDKAVLAGYAWGGPSQGTYENAARVTMNPTHLALGQADILGKIKGTEIPGTGVKYAFTVVQKDIGDECLYMVTKNPNYKTWGHILENAWDISITTGGELSGSYGTLTKVLQPIYPDLQDVVIETVGGNRDIIEAVASGRTTFGFFVMRPDPSNDIFKQINEKDLTLVPVIDFDLENVYTFKELKIATTWGGLGEGKYHQTACTQVQLITGDPNALSDENSRKKKRLDATIKRVSNIDSVAFKQSVTEKFASWSDYLDTVKEFTGEKLTAALEASKEAAKKGVGALERQLSK